MIVSILIFQAEMHSTGCLTIDMKALERELHGSMKEWRSFVHKNGEIVAGWLSSLVSLVSQFNFSYYLRE
jgi:hypothetical protein